MLYKQHNLSYSGVMFLNRYTQRFGYVKGTDSKITSMWMYYCGEGFPRHKTWCILLCTRHHFYHKNNQIMSFDRIKNRCVILVKAQIDLFRKAFYLTGKRLSLQRLLCIVCPMQTSQLLSLVIWNTCQD